MREWLTKADVFWYGLRAWIECGFKQTKRAGWQWHQTRMADPQRATRLWLALAVATLWVVSVGGEAEDNLPVSSFEALPMTHFVFFRFIGHGFISCLHYQILWSSVLCPTSVSAGGAAALLQTFAGRRLVKIG